MNDISTKKVTVPIYVTLNFTPVCFIFCVAIIIIPVTYISQYIGFCKR